MNAAQQDMFDSVRSVIGGRLRDEGEIRDLAWRLSEAASDARRRVERAVAYARAGLRLEAAAEAEAQPSVFELATALDTPEMRQWRAFCAKNGLPVPDAIAADAILEVEEAIALLAPLRKSLAKLRRLVLSDAGAWKRLAVLRDLNRRDPDNPAWHDDIRALEPFAADELGDAFEAELAAGRLDAAAVHLACLDDGSWASGGVHAVAARLRARLDHAQAGRVLGGLSAAVDRLDAERVAEDEGRARARLEECRDLEQRLLAFGGEMPGALVARIDAVEAWLLDRDHVADQVRENRERVAALADLAMSEGSTLAQLRAALRAAEQTVEGVPDDVRAVAERRIAALEARVRNRRMAIAAAVFIVVAAGIVASMLLVRRTAESNRIGAIAGAAMQQVTDGRLDEAGAALDEAERDPAVAADPRVRAVRDALARERGLITDNDRRFEASLADAGDPASPGARPGRADEALKFARTPAQQGQVVKWKREHAASEAERMNRRMQESLEAVRAINTELAGVKPDRGANWDGILAALETRLSEAERTGGEFPEVRAELDRGRALAQSHRSTVAAARTGAERDSKLVALGPVAAQPTALAAALEAFAQQFPDAPQSPDFRQAAAARAAWESLLAFGGIQPRPSPALATAPQPARSAESEALGAHLESQPLSPGRAAIDALRPLLAAAPAWRARLKERLAEAEDFRLYFVECKDGVRWYMRPDPAKGLLQPDGGRNLIVIGLRGKEQMQYFATNSIRSSGVSPQRDLSKQLAAKLDDEEHPFNDVAGALDVLAMVRDASSVDGMFRLLLLRDLLEQMVPEMPACIRPQMDAAQKRLGRGRPDDVDWKNTRDPEVTKRSREAAGLVVDQVKAEDWRKAYIAAVTAACAQFDITWRPVGVFVRLEGQPAMLPVASAPLAAGTELVSVRPGVGEEPSRTVMVAKVGKDGAVAFDASVADFPQGTPLFVAQRRGLQ